MKVGGRTTGRVGFSRTGLSVAATGSPVSASSGDLYPLCSIKSNEKSPASLRTPTSLSPGALSACVDEQDEKFDLRWKTVLQKANKVCSFTRSVSNWRSDTIAHFLYCVQVISPHIPATLINEQADNQDHRILVQLQVTKARSSSMKKQNHDSHISVLMVLKCMNTPVDPYRCL